MNDCSGARLQPSTQGGWGQAELCELGNNQGYILRSVSKTNNSKNKQNTRKPTVGK